MMSRMRETKWAQLEKKKWVNLIHLYVEALNESDYYLHVI